MAITKTTGYQVVWRGKTKYISITRYGEEMALDMAKKTLAQFKAVLGQHERKPKVRKTSYALPRHVYFGWVAGSVDSAKKYPYLKCVYIKTGRPAGTGVSIKKHGVVGACQFVISKLANSSDVPTMDILVPLMVQWLLETGEENGFSIYDIADIAQYLPCGVQDGDSVN